MFLEISGLLAAAVAAFILYYACRSVVRGRNDLPGPPPRFLIGNLLDLPKKDLHLGYARLTEKYGPIMKLETPTGTTIVIGSHKVAKDLLEKRGAISADRPPLHMARLSGWDWNLFVIRHGAEWKARRRVLHQYLGRHTNALHAGQQARTALVMAQSLLDSPDEFISHLKRASAANVLRTTYGLSVALEKDKYVDLADHAMDSWTTVTMPGVWAVDFLPILRHLPSWFPGLYFKKYALETKQYPDELLKAPFDWCLAEMEKGTAIPCLVTENLASSREENHVQIVKEAAGMMYIAGADTTSTTMQFFVLAMTMNPAIQRAAQEELDRVVGNDRLPTFDDRQSLPYIEAIIRELYRMYTVTLLGMHAMEQDDIYEGMYLRKGTTLLVNIWGILHDPQVYADPHTFRPERFLRNGEIDESMTDPREHFFGYGRRVCPGQYYADASIFIDIATILACFNIAKKVENGVEITPSGETRITRMNNPLPFKCAISSRSKKAVSLIAQGLEAE